MDSTPTPQRTIPAPAQQPATPNVQLGGPSTFFTSACPPALPLGQRVESSRTGGIWHSDPGMPDHGARALVGPQGRHHSTRKGSQVTAYLEGVRAPQHGAQLGSSPRRGHARTGHGLPPMSCLAQKSMSTPSSRSERAPSTSRWSMVRLGTSVTTWKRAPKCCWMRHSSAGWGAKLCLP